VNEQEYIESVGWLLKKARTDFLTYVALFRRDEKFIMGELHRFLIGIVQGVSEGKLSKRQAVSVPPQHGKSTILSVEAGSWLVGRFPGTQVAVTGYSFGLTTDFSREIRSRVADPLYQAIFPEAKLDIGHGQVSNWKLTNGSGVVAKSVGSKLTGRKVDYLIVDDPHAGRSEAESLVQRERVHQWYFGDCVTRLHPEGSIFIIGTRFHPEDLIGTLTDSNYIEDLIRDDAAEEVFQVTNLKALATDVDDALGREAGEPLFPEVRHAKFLNAVRATIPSYEWSSQYQGKPQTASTNIFDIENLNMVNDDEIPWDDLTIVRGWDLALTEKQTSDWSVGALVGGVKPSEELCKAARAEGLPMPLPDFYILDIVQVKLNWTKMKSKIISTSMADLDNYGVTRIGMEAVAAFDIALRETRQALIGKVTVEKRNPKNQGKKNQSSKLMRAQPWINLVEAGKVHVLRNRWNKALFSEMLTFPEGAHDDQIDGITVGYASLFMKKTLMIG
jgi:predicted phage terminase large subunit-like protein